VPAGGDICDCKGCEHKDRQVYCARKEISFGGTIRGMTPRVTQRTTQWLTEPEMQAWRALIQVTTGVLGALDNELQAEHGLSLGEYEVLVHLSEEPDQSLRMTDLAGRLHLSPSGITRRIDGLQRAGLVERKQCPSDRRGSNAVLTEEGLRVLREAAPTHVRGVRAHFIDQLSSRDIANLASALSSVQLDAEAAAGSCDEK
jgi:DNA-binding MarR family transcriptional regulator